MDIGSRTIKLVVMEEGMVVSSEVTDTTFDPLLVCEDLVARYDADRIVATGYGRRLFAERWPDTLVVSEIKAASLGARFVHPTCKTVVDIGGQDTKAIALDEAGRIAKFAMNDKCAAGTGRFLEVMAAALSLSMEEFVQVAGASEGTRKLSSMCTVFAESEVVSLVARGVPRDAIALGIHRSIAERTGGLVKSIPVEDDVIFVGGGALNSNLRDLLAKNLRRDLLAAEHPQIVVAIGAALAATLRPSPQWSDPSTVDLQTG